MFAILIPRVVAFVILGSVASAQFTPNWVPAASIDVGAVTTALLVTDVVGSSAPDILILTYSQLRIVENLGMAVVPSIVTINVSGGGEHLAAGDLDGDGDRDILVASTTQVTILLRTGTTWTQTLIATLPSDSVRMADVDSDGDLDIVRGSHASLAAAPGVFVSTPPVALVTGVLSSRAVLGDYDGDGDQDLAIIRGAGTAAPTLERWTNGGTIPFTLTETLALPACMTNRAESGDLNGDGTDDLCILSRPEGFEVVLCFANAPSILSLGAYTTTLPSVAADLVPGSYTQSSTTWSSDVTRPILADIDGNGTLDVATRTAVSMFNVFFVTYANYTSSVFALNDGNGRMVTPTTFFLDWATGPWQEARQAFGDLNGDGKIELVRARDLGSAVDILLGQGTGAAPTTNPVPASITPGGPVMSNALCLHQLRVFVRDGAGNLMPGVRVDLSLLSSIGGATFNPCATPKATGAQGFINLTGLGLAMGNSVIIQASTANGLSTTFTVKTILPVTLAATGVNQPGFTVQGTPYPITVVATTAGGVAAPGLPLRIETPTGIGGFPVTYETRYTDPNGFLEFEPTIGDALGGPVNFYVKLPEDQIFTGYGSGSSVQLAIPVWVRVFDVTNVNSQLNVVYYHEHGPVPLVFTADLPSVTPTETLAGTVYTSVLEPTPTALVFDAAGTFGTPPISELIANPTAAVSFVIPPALAGTTWLFQMFAFDPAYWPDLRLSMVISNPQIVTL